MIIGIKTYPIFIVLIPTGIIFLWFLTNHVGFTLILLSFLTVVKGVIIEFLPVFATIDITILLTIIIWFGLIKLLLAGEWNYIEERKQSLVLFILFTSIVAFSFFFTPSPEYGANKILRFSLIGMTMFITPLIVIQSRNDVKQLLQLFIYSVFLLLFAVLAQFVYFLFLGKFALLLGYFNRFSLPGANPIQVGRFLAIGATFMLVNLIRKSNINSITIIISLITLLLGMIATGSRGPLVSIILGLLIYVYLFEKEKRQQIFIYGIFFVFISVGILLLFPEDLTRRFFDMTQGAVLMTSEGVKKISTIATRFNYWQMSLESWVSSLWNNIFGLGAGGFSSLFIWRDWRWYPHNVFFEIMVEFGLVGITIFTCFLLAALNDIRKGLIKGSLSDHSALWIAATLVMFIAAQFSGDINDNRLLWMLIGISVASTHIDQLKNVKSTA
ncbi:MAG: O-antigen ligase family protein [Candidatus Marinimicrobia bacterium]|nr:O-antigen ligase family protein [Candidatus Neomarinimicrobiota bacterium]